MATVFSSWYGKSMICKNFHLTAFFALFPAATKTALVVWKFTLCFVTITSRTVKQSKFACWPRAIHRQLRLVTVPGFQFKEVGSWMSLMIIFPRAINREKIARFNFPKFCYSNCITNLQHHQKSRIGKKFDECFYTTLVCLYATRLVPSSEHRNSILVIHRFSLLSDCLRRRPVVPKWSRSMCRYRRLCQQSVRILKGLSRTASIFLKSLRVLRE